MSLQCVQQYCKNTTYISIVLPPRAHKPIIINTWWIKYKIWLIWNCLTSYDPYLGLFTFSSVLTIKQIASGYTDSCIDYIVSGHNNNITIERVCKTREEEEENTVTFRLKCIVIAL